jgi:hypothetical protein
MGLILRPSEMESGVQQIRSELNNMKDGYSGVMQTVLGFSGNEALQSQSWNRAKERIQETHQCIVQGMWAAQTLVEKDLDSLEASMDGAEDLDEDELFMQIKNLTEECEYYEFMIRMYQSMQVIENFLKPAIISSIAYQIVQYQKLLKQTEEELDLLKTKLQMLFDKADETSGLFQEISALLDAIDCAINDAMFYITGQGKLSGEKWKIEISEAVQRLEEKDIFMEYYFACELGVSLEAFQGMYGEKLVSEVQEYTKDYSMQGISDLQRQEINLFILGKCCDCSSVRVEDGKYQLCNVSGKAMCEVNPEEVGATVMNRAFANKDIKINYIAGYLKEKLQIEDSQVAAIMGNMQMESGFSPLKWQGESPDDLYNPEYIQLYAGGINTSGGWGLIQWTDSGRKRGLYDYAVSKGNTSYFGDMDTQLEYLVYELTEGECKGLFEKFKEKKDVVEATDYFCDEMERPEKREAHKKEREEAAKVILENIEKNK